jgi:hypothetical protein
MAVALLLSVPAAHAELKGSDEEFYAVFVAALESCERTFPDAKADYDKVRSSLQRLAQTNPKLSAALKSPTLAATLAQARAEIDGFLAQADRKVICAELKQGRFGQMEIPVER